MLKIYERRRTAFSRVNIQEDIDVLFNEAKIIYKSQIKLQNLIRKSTEIMTRKNDVCNDNTSLNIHEMFEFLGIAV